MNLPTLGPFLLQFGVFAQNIWSRWCFLELFINIATTPNKVFGH